MSIKPLDLQTLFTKMAQVGKDQALIQKSVENQQSREASHIVKQENSRDHSVNKAEEDKEVQKTKDKESSSNDTFTDEEQKKESQEHKDEKQKYFTDPKRGHNIDITG